MTNVDSDRQMAHRAFGRLRGLIVQDLKAMQNWAVTFDARTEKPPDVGALNFALAMTALVGCEALGFLLCGGSAHQKAQASPKPVGIVAKKLCRTIMRRCASSHRWPDVGGYISETIKQAFPKGSAFKHLDKILSDYLRHALVHGFGSDQRGTDFDVSLIVRPADVFQADIDESKKPPVLRVNSVALAEDTIKAFDAVEKQLGSDVILWSNFARALTINLPIGGKVQHQFEAFRRRVAASRR